MGETGLSWRIFSTFSDPCVSRRLHRSLYTSVTSCTPGIRWPMLYYNPEQYSRLEFCSFVISKAANKVSVNFRGKVGHYRNGSLCYCFSLVGQHLYISSARKFNECQRLCCHKFLYGRVNYDDLWRRSSPNFCFPFVTNLCHNIKFSIGWYLCCNSGIRFVLGAVYPRNFSSYEPQ